MVIIKINGLLFLCHLEDKSELDLLLSTLYGAYNEIFELEYKELLSKIYTSGQRTIAEDTAVDEYYLTN